MFSIVNCGPQGGKVRVPAWRALSIGSDEGLHGSAAARARGAEDPRGAGGGHRHGLGTSRADGAGRNGIAGGSQVKSGGPSQIRRRNWEHGVVMNNICP